MADPQSDMRIAVDPPPQDQEAPIKIISAHAEPQAGGEGAYPPQQQQQQRKPHGPQLWAVVLTLGGLYYVWTRILGKSLPSFARRGHRIGANKGKVGGGSSGGGSGGSSSRRAEIAAARERQQQRLQTASRAREMMNQAKSSGTVRERTNATTTTNNKLSINQQAQLLREQQAQKQKAQDLLDKKKKQRQLYLKQKALEEKEEEERRKDEELGPGWRAREDPRAAMNGMGSNMDPQSGSGGGGYKPQSCKKKSG
jgi:hypothetical protein